MTPAEFSELSPGRYASRSGFEIEFVGLHDIEYRRGSEVATLYFEHFADEPQFGIFGDDVRWKAQDRPLSTGDRDAILANVTAILRWKGFPVGVIWRNDVKTGKPRTSGYFERFFPNDK